MAGPNAHRTGACYGNIGCRRPECVAKHAKRMGELRDRRLARPVPPHLHGRATTYTNYGCRCSPCSEAWGDYMRDYRARRRG